MVNVAHQLSYQLIVIYQNFITNLLCMKICFVRISIDSKYKFFMFIILLNMMIYTFISMNSEFLSSSFNIFTKKIFFFGFYKTHNIELLHILINCSLSFFIMKHDQSFVQKFFFFYLFDLVMIFDYLNNIFPSPLQMLYLMHDLIFLFLIQAKIKEKHNYIIRGKLQIQTRLNVEQF